jgi:hypothetical protein
MNLRKSVLLGAVAIFATVSSVLADVTINITGATAFRAAAHTSIIATLGGNGVVEYAYSTSAGAAAANLATADRSIFVGPVSGLGIVTVRCSWSGSTAGIGSVVTASPVSVPLMTTSVSTTGVNGGISFETVVPKFSFSDVAQAASNNPTPALNGTQVGVVPFMFLAQEGAPSGITTMTDQLFASLYSTGSAPLSTFTGSAADEDLLVVPTGRNTGSGTRVTILAETGYGFSTTVNQFQPTIVAGEVTALGSASNNGYSSNSGVRTVLETPMSAGLSESFLFVAYLTISDALQAITNGAKELTYNGVAYSEENVKNGSYSLWGYQWLYNADGLTTDETTFLDTFVATIPANLGTAGIPIPDMRVTRQGGDGGQILTDL